MTKFHSQLSTFVKQHDSQNANRVVMQELARVLVERKKDFVELLNYAKVYANEQMSDAELITLFMDNINTNKNLMLGAALLVNVHNKTVGFDGAEEISDAGVKATYKTMCIYFDADHYPDPADFYYSAEGGLFGSIVDTVGGLGGKVLDSQRAKKFGALDTLNKKQDAKNQMVQSVLSQRQAQIEQQTKAKEQRAKTIRLSLIIGGSIVGVLAIIGVVYYIKKHKS